MNAVELDVGNLKAWLNSNTGTGKNVDYATQNGYVLYFSDRRGMQYDPVHSPTACWERTDSKIPSITAAAPRSRPITGWSPPTTMESRPDVEQWNDNTLSTYGAKTVGDAFGTQTTSATDTASPKNPYAHASRATPSAASIGSRGRATC